MRKKVLPLLIVLAVLLTGVICLAACDKDVKYYFTISNGLEHCNIDVMSQSTDSSGAYVLKGDQISLRIYTDSGYYFDSLRLQINGADVSPVAEVPTNGYTSVYTYSFVPESDATITASGEIKQITGTLRFEKELYYDADALKDVYIRFASNTFGLPTTEKTLPKFEEITRTFSRSILYGQTLEFYVYTKEYRQNIQPDAIRQSMDLDSEAYINETKGEYGIRYTYTKRDSDLPFTIGTTWQGRTSFVVSEMSASGNDLYSDKIDMSMQDSTLTINLKNYADIPAATKAALKLRINDKLLDVNFATGQNENGVFTINLERPYKYLNEGNLDISQAYSYSVDLNFYTLDYFADVVFANPQ